MVLMVPAQMLKEIWKVLSASGVFGENGDEINHVSVCQEVYIGRPALVVFIQCCNRLLVIDECGYRMHAIGMYRILAPIKFKMRKFGGKKGISPPIANIINLG